MSRSTRVFAACFSGFTQVAKYPSGTIDTTTGSVGVANDADQTLVFNRTVRDRFVQPLVEPGTRHIQDSAHQHERILVAMLVHDSPLLVLFEYWLIEYDLVKIIILAISLAFAAPAFAHKVIGIGDGDTMVPFAPAY
jgi:hypothetical protein